MHTFLVLLQACATCLSQTTFPQKLFTNHISPVINFTKNRLEFSEPDVKLLEIVFLLVAQSTVRWGKAKRAKKQPHNKHLFSWSQDLIYVCHCWFWVNLGKKENLRNLQECGSHVEDLLLLTYEYVLLGGRLEGHYIDVLVWMLQ